MYFLETDNYKIICKVIQDLISKKLSKKDQLLVYHAMKEISKKNKSKDILLLNKKTIQLILPFVEENKIVNPLEKLPLNDKLKRSFNVPLIDQRLDNSFLINQNKDIYIKTFKDTVDEFNKMLKSRKPVTTRNEERQKLPSKFTEFINNIYREYEKTHYVSIDSRDRNHDQYESNDYKVNLPFELKDVKRIELINATIPNTQYSINSTNNKLFFQELNSQVSGGTYYTATITPGYYTITTLISAIQTQLNAVGSSGYTVQQVGSKVRIISDVTGGDNIFNLVFQGDDEIYESTTRTTYINNSIGPIIGFDKLNYTGSTNYTSPFNYNITSSKYIYLKIKNLNNKTFSSNEGDMIFGKLIFDNVGSGEILYYTQKKSNVISQDFKPPLEKLSKLEISFTSYDNNLYDFNGHEHSLLFKVTTYYFDKEYKNN